MAKYIVRLEILKELGYAVTAFMTTRNHTSLIRQFVEQARINIDEADRRMQQYSQKHPPAQSFTLGAAPKPKKVTAVSAPLPRETWEHIHQSLIKCQTALLKLGDPKTDYRQLAFEDFNAVSKLPELMQHFPDTSAQTMTMAFKKRSKPGFPDAIDELLEEAKYDLLIHNLRNSLKAFWDKHGDGIVHDVYKGSPMYYHMSDEQIQFTKDMIIEPMRKLINNPDSSTAFMDEIPRKGHSPARPAEQIFYHLVVMQHLAAHHGLPVIAQKYGEMMDHFTKYVMPQVSNIQECRKITPHPATGWMFGP